MAISTPRGLKIRLPIKYAFALIARVYPKVSPLDVLKSTDDIKELPAALAFVACSICFYLNLPSLQIGVIVFSLSVIVSQMTRRGLLIIIGLVKVARVYNYLSGIGILYIVFGFWGLYWSDWQGIVAFLAGRLLSTIIDTILDWRDKRRINEDIGVPLTSPEKNFISAYRLHAGKLNITTVASVTDEEMAEENWSAAFKELSARWPKGAEKFNDE